MIKQYKAVIFDMDGLLLDTERIALDAFVDACRVYDFEPDIDIYLNCIGTTYTKTREILSNGYGRDFPFNNINKIWEEKYKTAIFKNPIPLKPGANNLLNYFQKTLIKMAVATSTKYEVALEKLQRTGIDHHFQIIMGGDQVEKGKPDPEIYLKVSILLMENPRDCLVLEDSDNGVLSAHGAGMDVIQIPDLKKPSAEIKNLGHPILPSLEEVKDFLNLT